MHQIIFGIREIKPDELPMVPDEQGALRAATDAELLDLGYSRISGDYFSSAHQMRTDSSGAWRVLEGHERHGRALSEGSLIERHRKLQEPHRSQILRARVFRSMDPTEDLNSRTAAVLARARVPAAAQEDAMLEHLRHRAQLGVVKQLRIQMAEIQPGDVVEDDELPPHQWQGE